MDGEDDDIRGKCLFSGAIALAGGLFVVGARLTPIDPEAEVTARTLPYIVAGTVAAYGVGQVAVLLRRARTRRRPRIAGHGIVLSSILPLSLCMALYVPAIQALGYLTATIVMLAAVFWLFGARDRILTPVLVAAGAGASQLCFVVLLAMYFPDGWLIDALRRALGF